MHFQETPGGPDMFGQNMSWLVLANLFLRCRLVTRHFQPNNERNCEERDQSPAKADTRRACVSQGAQRVTSLVPSISDSMHRYSYQRLAMATLRFAPIDRLHRSHPSGEQTSVRLTLWPTAAPTLRGRRSAFSCGLLLALE